MKERPILFSAPMIRALLDGTKTQTRRALRLPKGASLDGITKHECPPYEVFCSRPGQPVGSIVFGCPYGVPGDRLWVRETWYDDLSPPTPFIERQRREDGGLDGLEYRASHDCTNWEAGCPCNPDGDGKRSEWRPSIHMPRWASRITLEITDVRVERVQVISEEDARAEAAPIGETCRATINGERGTVMIFDPRKAFAMLWDSINAKRAPWSSNPWVWALTFRRVTP